MGLSISWLSVNGKSKGDVLAALELVDTGAPASESNVELCVGVSAKGWVVIVSNDLEYVTPAKLRELSRGATAIGCLEEEHVMFSGVRCFVDGTEAWAVIHEADKGLRHLHVEGQPPPQFGRIRSRELRKQQVEDPKGKLVDYVYDVPPKLAAAVCSVRPHGLGYKVPRYTMLRPLNAEPPRARTATPWWRKLLRPLARTSGR